MPVARQAFTTEFAVGGGGVNFASHAVGLQLLHGVEHLHHHGPGTDEANERPVTLRCATKQVHALDDALVNPFWLGRHGVVFVVDGDVVEHILIVNVHFLNAVSDDGGEFVGERRVPRTHRWVGVRHEERVPVLMLQPLTVERCPT